MSLPNHLTADSFLPSYMRAAVLDQFGGPENLTVRSVPVPTPGSGDVLLRVEVAGVGSWDAEEREGDYEGAFGIASTFPYILGWDAAGTVVDVGRDVTGLSVGDRVYAATIPVPRGGFYAEYAAVDAERVSPVPIGLPMAQAGALAWDGATALGGLDALELSAGATLMVFGASGGIGHLALQLARHQGLQVLAVASGDDGLALARGLGAHAVVDGRREDVLSAARDFAPDGLDAAIVTAGGPVVEHALTGLRPSGRIAWANGVSPAPSKDLRVLHYDGDPGRATTNRLNAIIESGELQVHVAKNFTLDTVIEAHRALGEHHIGKFAMTVNEEA